MSGSGNSRCGRGYNSAGYDKEGYNKDGYDVAGYTKRGYNKYGYHKRVYKEDGHDGDGYNKRGYNDKGWNRSGNNQQGHYIADWQCCGKMEENEAHDIPGKPLSGGGPICDEHEHSACWGEEGGCQKIDGGVVRPEPLVSIELMMSTYFKALLTDMISPFQTPFYAAGTHMPLVQGPPTTYPLTFGNTYTTSGYVAESRSESRTSGSGFQSHASGSGVQPDASGSGSRSDPSTWGPPQ